MVSSGNSTLPAVPRNWSRRRIGWALTIFGLWLSHRGDFLSVGGNSEDTSRVNTSNLQVAGSYPAPWSVGLAYSTDDALAFIPRFNSSQIAAYDANGYSLLRSIARPPYFT